MLPIAPPVNHGVPHSGISRSLETGSLPRPVDWTECQPFDRFRAISVDYTAGIDTSRALPATSKPFRYL
jgi:hypothetical protein